MSTLNVLAALVGVTCAVIAGAAAALNRRKPAVAAVCGALLCALVWAIRV